MGKMPKGSLLRHAYGHLGPGPGTVVQHERVGDRGGGQAETAAGGAPATRSTECAQKVGGWEGEGEQGGRKRNGQVAQFAKRSEDFNIHTYQIIITTDFFAAGWLLPLTDDPTDGQSSPAPADVHGSSTA
uniref:Uncharacterized protein n=1 Tax=Oryza punctata TaxID=4537 RepID=A0A0E0JUL3_ORYPU